MGYFKRRREAKELAAALDDLKINVGNLYTKMQRFDYEKAKSLDSYAKKLFLNDLKLEAVCVINAQAAKIANAVDQKDKNAVQAELAKFNEICNNISIGVNSDEYLKSEKQQMLTNNLEQSNKMRVQQLEGVIAQYESAIREKNVMRQRLVEEGLRVKNDKVLYAAVNRAYSACEKDIKILQGKVLAHCNTREQIISKMSVDEYKQVLNETKTYIDVEKDHEQLEKDAFAVKDEFENVAMHSKDLNQTYAQADVSSVFALTNGISLDSAVEELAAEKAIAALQDEEPQMAPVNAEAEDTKERSEKLDSLINN